MDRASVLYGAVTALYTAAVILKVIRDGLKLGLWWVFSLFLVFVGMPLCFIKLPGYSGLLLLSLGYLISHSMLARSEKLLLVGNKAVLITGKMFCLIFKYTTDTTKNSHSVFNKHEYIQCKTFCFLRPLNSHCHSEVKYNKHN